MNIFSIRKLVALSAMAMTIAAVPGTASARSSVHLDLPGFSIGFHDDHRYRKRHRRHHKRHYRKHRYYDRHYYPRRYYYDDYGYRSRGYDRRRYRDNYEYCPTPGFSTRYYRNRGCYSHGDHYHCDD